jgi:hypothetical protein
MAKAPVYALNASLIRSRAARACMYLYEVADQAGLARAHFCRLLGGYEYPSPITRRRLLTVPLFEGLGFDDLFVEVQRAS